MMPRRFVSTDSAVNMDATHSYYARHLVECAGVLLSMAPVLAQQLPDAGRQLRQTEQERRPALPPATAPMPVLPGEAPSMRSPGGGPTLQLQAFRFEGNTLLSSEVLRETIASYLQRPVQLVELEDAAAVLAQRYRQEGWLARVVIAPQEIQSGVFTFQIVEATFGASRLSEDTDAALLPMPAQAIVDRVEARQQRGAPVHLPSVERGLLIANDLPGVRVQGSQVAGSADTQSDVLLRVSPTPRVFGELALDNYGARSTGEARLSGRLGWANPLGLGEQFDVQGQLTRGLQYVRLAGSVP
jgi:hemolysin activation/secretion protein